MTVAMAPGVKLDPTSMAANVPLKRAGTEEASNNFHLSDMEHSQAALFQDMTGTILFLASRAGAYVNGAIWLVDGGRVSSMTSTLSY